MSDSGSGERYAGGSQPERRLAREPDAAQRPVHAPMTRVVAGGTVAWALALVVTLLVPALRTAERWWWPWCCVAAVALGGLGLAYLSLGRGNAADA